MKEIEMIEVYDRGFVFTAVMLNLASVGINIYLAFKLLKALNIVGGLLKWLTEQYLLGV